MLTIGDVAIADDELVEVVLDEMAAFAVGPSGEDA
jgi:hypothetical protein